MLQLLGTWRALTGAWQWCRRADEAGGSQAAVELVRESSWRPPGSYDQLGELNGQAILAQGLEHISCSFSNGTWAREDR
jgi:hypothetical protein